MAFSTQYAQQYQQAVSAYMQGHYEDATTLTDQLVSEYPDDPNLQLLCGHIHSCLQRYDAAQRHYRQVLRLTNDSELLNCAQNSLADVAQILGDPSADDLTGPMENWTEMAALSDGDLTQIQVGLSSSNGRMDRSKSGLNLTLHNKIESSLTTELKTDWSDLQLDDMSSEDELLSDSVLDPSSDLFDEDDDITLLMGKKGSQKPEGSMSNDQFSEQPMSEYESQNLNPNPSESIGSDEALLEFMPPLSEQLDDGNGFDQEFTEFLSHIDDDQDNLTQFGSPDANRSGESDLEFSSAPDDDLNQNFGMGAPMPERAKTSENALSSGQFVGPSGVSLQADKAAALNMTSRRLPLLAPFENAPLQQKQLMMAASTGVVSGLAVIIVGQLGGAGANGIAKIGLGALAAGLAGGATTLALGQVVTKQLKASTIDLQAKLAAVSQGDWGVKAIEFSQDEFGQLAKSFNQMTQFIEVTTKDAQRKAEEQEKAKEDLQRQVIRLLDDVEGAARGDLTVQAEVTADILGAVADSFNLTIYNLQKIVKQVKVAAREVNKGAAENEEFARGLSSDALRQAEELAATLNSVQMMTNSIQEVADSARAADNVAQQASEAALRGGESVESTVAGILQIRETVAETTRKVKRLAESSQEISKIVGLISQIASRTNLLALNASIEAARAGESGRGFAVVADEVRQLADRAAKASKEIEQIVLQIQGETSSVMTAMEEGTQQVIEGTQRAEQAKHSLENIIQVSDQIKQLVSSITKATSEQTETSRYVAQVMQSVELTAQETSQESQRVSDSLRNLVGVARDLQASVERFKVEGTEFS